MGKKKRRTEHKAKEVTDTIKELKDLDDEIDESDWGKGSKLSFHFV